MKKIIMFGLIGLTIIIAALAFIFLSEPYIQHEIKKANYCDVKEDCVNANTKCPFGCGALVNKKEVNRINNLIDAFPSNCVYSCLRPCQNVECRDNLCQAVCN